MKTPSLQSPMKTFLDELNGTWRAELCYNQCLGWERDAPVVQDEVIACIHTCGCTVMKDPVVVEAECGQHTQPPWRKILLPCWLLDTLTFSAPSLGAKCNRTLWHLNFDYIKVSLLRCLLVQESMQKRRKKITTLSLPSEYNYNHVDV